ncbi:hypothetical protein BST61_g5551 [Cercospora zeina]
MPGSSEKWTKHSTSTNESGAKKVPRPQGNNDKMTARTVSSTTSSSRSASSTSPPNNRHMGERKASDIASWTAGVPAQSTNPNGVMYDEENPAVQAYIQLKMSLFQRLAGTTGRCAFFHAQTQDHLFTFVACEFANQNLTSFTSPQTWSYENEAGTAFVA